MEPALIVAALLMGITGSLHCAGMCGPIIWIIPFQAFSGWRKVLAFAGYHVGRISVYATMGVVLHSFRSLFHPAVQQYISIGMGIVMLTAGLLSFINYKGFRVRMPWDDWVKKQLGNIIGKPSLTAITFAGIFNGLLPCGLVYMALSASVMLVSVGQAAAVMFLFGLGTLPMTIGISLFKIRFRLLNLGRLKRLTPVFVFALGCLFVLRGLNMGIPYVSPKVTVTANGIHSTCCHR